MGGVVAENAPQAIELATAYVSIVGETDKLAKSVKNAMRAAQRHADANPINVKADVDVSHIGGIEIPVVADTTRFDQQVRDAISDAQDYARLHPIDIKANVDVSHIGRVEIPIDPNTFHFAQELSRALREMEASGLFRFSVPVDLDSAAALAQFAALRRALEQMASDPIRQRVEIDADRNSLDRVRSALSLGGLTKGTAIASGVAGAIAGITGAAGAALGAVGALGVGIAGLGPIAAAAAGTVAVGMQGIGDAFKALSAADDSAAADAEARSKAVAAAQEQLRSALDGVEDAQRDLASAQKDSRDAAEDVARAYKDAADELEDYHLQLKDASLSEAEAALALREAREEFAKAPPEDREKAFLRLQRAELRYQQAQERNRDLQEEAAEAFAKGVEGSDQVVAAKDRQAQADQRVVDAERNLTRANEQVAKAQDALTEAATKTSAAQDKAAQAFAELSPNAQAFVTAVRDITPAWDDLTNAVQDSLFDGAAEGISDLARNSLPTLKAGMVDVGQSMNALTRSFSEFWQAPQNLDAVREIFAGTADFISGMTDGLHQMTTGFLSFGQAFTPVAEKVGQQFGGMLGNIGQAFTDAFESGTLTQLFSTFGDILEGLGGGLNSLIDGLIEIGNIVGPTLAPFFQAFGDAIKDMGPALGQIGAVFVDTLTAILPDLSKFVAALAEGLAPVLPVIGDLLQSVMKALTPLIGPLSQIAQTVGTALVQAIDALAPAIGPLGTAFASLVSAVAPILPVLAKVVSTIIQALAPALTVVFEALAPVIQSVAEAFLPILEDLAPILSEVAMTIGLALADALQAIAPVLPDLIKAWGDWVLAITPILPVLARMVAELLPPLIDLLVEFAPIILKIIEAFTWLVTNVIQKLVIPYVERMTEVWKTGIETATNVVRTAKNFLSGALEDIGGFFTGLGTKVKSVWDGIVSTIKSAVRKIGAFLVSLPEINIPAIPGVTEGMKFSFRGVGQAMVNWADSDNRGTMRDTRRGMRSGGLFRGAGSGTSDSNIIRISDREFVVNAKSTAANLPLLEAINAGWVPSAAALHAMFPGFAGGGLVEAQQWARGEAGKPYQYGGTGNPSWDCSGFMGGIWAVLTGKDPRRRYFSTESDFEAMGFVKGLGGPNDFSIGVMRGGGGPNSHMAGTLGGLNVESNGSDGVEVGPSAASAASFPLKWHWPLSGDPGGEGAVSGGRPSKLGGGGGGAIKGGRPSKLGSRGGGGGGGGSDSSDLDTGGEFVGETPVFVTNWPTGLELGGPATEGLTGPQPVVTTDPNAPLMTTSYGPEPAPAEQGPHPLSGLPIPGAELFDGPAPWYMAATPEQALANLGTQAASLATRTGSDVVGFFQDNWREMLETGLAVGGMGATGAISGPMTVNNYGMDPGSAAAAVERVYRRRTLAQQRSGGFGR
ncbi:hypothetical protein IU487_22430 [Nocardia puris]|uniref:phage tail protein n=1 Tax=Nocardia puris TaxID=208602 RepID=UPI001892D765|nr:hypothetical protein [Nocardia puris]MBF6213778.1 hypothetical protein [Nocardia puris]